MMRTQSLHFRLTVWYAAALAAALAVFCGLLYFSLSHRLVGEIDRDLAGRADRFERYFAYETTKYPGNAGEVKEELEEFCQALSPSSYLELRGDHGFAFRYAQAPPEKHMRTLHRSFTLNGETYSLDAGEPSSRVAHTLELLRVLLFSLIPVAIALASLGGAWLSRRALKPVDEIARAAHAISIENLSERLPVPASADEIARLSNVLNEMLARLEAAVKTLSQFVADASHELRTPLAVIRTTAELALRRAREPEVYRASLQEIAADTERLTRLVEDLLALARSDTGTVEMPLSPLDLREAAANVAAELRPLAELRRVRVTVDTGGAAVIHANARALHRLLVVLLDNAIKYSREGGEVRVTVAPSEITIEDFGIGIAAADLPHIFRRFYRSDRARSDGGYGLGLSLAESIAKAHGAEIEVHSREGEGSTFRVKFPERAASGRDGSSANLQLSSL